MYVCMHVCMYSENTHLTLIFAIHTSRNVRNCLQAEARRKDALAAQSRIENFARQVVEAGLSKLRKVHETQRIKATHRHSGEIAYEV